MGKYLDLRCSRRLTVKEGQMVVAAPGTFTAPDAARIVRKIRAAIDLAMAPRTPAQEWVAARRAECIRRTMADIRNAQAAIPPTYPIQGTP